jgi:hypothetical protein
MKYIFNSCSFGIACYCIIYWGVIVKQFRYINVTVAVFLLGSGIIGICKVDILPSSCIGLNNFFFESEVGNLLFFVDYN